MATVLHSSSSSSSSYAVVVVAVVVVVVIGVIEATAVFTTSDLHITFNKLCSTHGTSSHGAPGLKKKKKKKKIAQQLNS